MNIHPRSREAYQLLHNGLLAFARAEQVGMRVDVDACERKKSFLTKKIRRLEHEVLDSKFGRRWEHTVGNRKINLNSNHQLAHYLYKVRNLTPTKNTPSGRGATDDEALKDLGIPEVEKILEMRKLRKIRDTYLDAYTREQVGGIIHPFFNLHLARTYRSSSDHPNFQNIPIRDAEAMRLVRSVLLPRLGHQFLSGDYSGVEVRMACVYTEDPKLIHDTIHGDMHRDMAIELYMLDDLDKRNPGEKTLRQGAKNGFVFPEFYGDYYEHCAQGLLKWAEQGALRDGTPALVHLQDKGLVKLDKAGKIRNPAAFVQHVRRVEDSFWNKRYRVYNRWKDRIWRRYQRKGYIDLLTGFRCSGLMSKKDVTNYPFQGTAFHCLLWSFVEVDKEINRKGWESRLVSQVHDELIIDAIPGEVKELARTVKRIATEDLPAQWTWLNKVPLEVEFALGEVNASMAERKIMDV